jgi:hypothetical protein
MQPLPRSDDLTSLILRVDFDDDRRWEAFVESLSKIGDYPVATFVSDTAYAGATLRQLVDADAAADIEDKVFYQDAASAFPCSSTTTSRRTSRSPTWISPTSLTLQKPPEPIEASTDAGNSPTSAPAENKR